MAFGRGGRCGASPAPPPAGIRPPRVSTGPNGKTATRPPSSSSTRSLTRRPATRTSPTSSAQSAPSLQKQPHDTTRLSRGHRPRIRRRLRRTPPPHARIHLDHPDRPHLQEPSMNYARLFETILEFIHEYDLPQPMSVNAFLGDDDYNAVTLMMNGRNDAP